MPVFAELDASGYVVVIAALVTGLTSLISAVAAAIVLVKQAAMKKDIRTIEQATNSMKDALVAKAGAEGVARGGMEERARADDRKVVADQAAVDAGAAAEIKADIAAVPEKVVDEIDKRDGSKG
jgi:hypothetical protein